MIAIIGGIFRPGEVMGQQMHTCKSVDDEDNICGVQDLELDERVHLCGMIFAYWGVVVNIIKYSDTRFFRVVPWFG
jgi:hypothetical protein